MGEYEDALGFLVSRATEEQAIRLNNAAIERVKWYRELKNMNIRATLVTGARVYFDSRKGFRVKGKIIKVNPSTAKVKADDGQVWSVSLSLVKKDTPPFQPKEGGAA